MDEQLKSLKGKKVLITGSSRGIGLAMAEGFAQNGAVVALHGTKPGDCMDAALQKLSAYGSGHIALFGDLIDPTAPAALVKETTARLGSLDILICNASVQIRKPWLEISEEEMERQTRINFFATVRLMQQAVPSMKANGWGRIITVGSVQQEKPHPDMLIYSANKSAVRNVVRSLALQLAGDNITVNNIAVGTVYTDRNAEVLRDAAYHEAVRESIPVGWIGDPHDCTGTVLLLSSDAGRYITGENIHIDGGKFL